MKNMPQLLLLLCCAALAQCVGGGGGGGGSGGSAGVAGVEGNPCDPALYDEGCLTKKRMKCDAASKKWTLIAECAANEYCAESQEAGGGMLMRKSECKASPGGGIGPGTGGDSGSSGSGDTAASGADATGGSADGGGAETAAVEIVTDPPKDVGADAQKEVVVVNDTGGGGKVSACLASQCVEQWSACGADSKCIAFLACADGCSTQACAATCAQKNFSEATVVLSQCAATSSCLGGSSGPVCGNGKCETGETNATCPQDCKATTDCCAANGFNCGYAAKCGKSCGTCPSAQTCTANVCKGGSGGNCVQDNCGSQVSACQADPNCMAIWAYAALGGCVKDNNCQDQACVDSNCSKQMQQCQSISACTQLLTCLGNCQGDQTCANKCPTANGLSKYQALGDCAKTNCP